MTFISRRLREERQGFAPLSSTIPAGIRMGKGWWGWYKRWREHRKAKEQANRAARILRRIGFVVIILLIGVIVLVGSVQALISMQVLTPQRILSLTGTDLPVDADGFTNILLLGTGDDDYDGRDLTDSIILASIDPQETKSVAMLSIPRDLYVTQTEKMGRGRVNSLYLEYKWSLVHEGLSEEEASAQAMRELASELGRKLGMQVHHVVKIDFTGFVEAVDALGGIDIEVPEDLVDTKYPGPNFGYETFSIKAGPQHVDGETALKYARSRYSTSDFSRSARQQQILQAIAHAAKEQGAATSPGKIRALWKILSENVETTMSFGELLGAGKLVSKIDRQNIISMNLHDLPGEPGGLLYPPPRVQFGGASVLLPDIVGDERMGSWRQLRAFTYVLLHSRTTLLAHPQITILNAGAPSGLARILALELSLFGFPVTKVANLGEGPLQESDKRETSLVLPQLDTDTGLAEFFASLLRLPVAPPQNPESPDIPLAQLGQVTIILGKDYSFTRMQELVPSEELELQSSEIDDLTSDVQSPNPPL